MKILDIKLARHNVVPVLVANSDFRGYNFGTMPAMPGKLVYKIEEIDLSTVDFKFPAMTDRKNAMEAYLFS